MVVVLFYITSRMKFYHPIPLKRIDQYSQALVSIEGMNLLLCVLGIIHTLPQTRRKILESGLCDNIEQQILGQWARLSSNGSIKYMFLLLSFDIIFLTFTVEDNANALDFFS